MFKHNIDDILKDFKRIRSRLTKAMVHHNARALEQNRVATAALAAKDQHLASVERALKVRNNIDNLIGT